MLGSVDFLGVVGGLTGILHELLEVRCIEDSGEGVLVTLSLLVVRRIWIGFLGKPTLGGDADKFAASSAIRDFISTLNLEFQLCAMQNTIQTYRGTKWGFQTPALLGGAGGGSEAIRDPSASSIMKISSPDGGRRIVRCVIENTSDDSAGLDGDNVDLFVAMLTPRPCGRLGLIIGSGKSSCVNH